MEPVGTVDLDCTHNNKMYTVLFEENVPTLLSLQDCQNWFSQGVDSVRQNVLSKLVEESIPGSVSTIFNTFANVFLVRCRGGGFLRLNNVKTVTHLPRPVPVAYKTDNT